VSNVNIDSSQQIHSRRRLFKNANRL